MKRSHLEFLPAALEIQSTPPLPMGRTILWAIVLFFTIGVAWAIVGEVDIVGVAEGKIVPSGRVKIIQPLETGVVQQIYVSEGDYVSAGEPLIALDTTLAGADSERIGAELHSLRLDKARLETLLSRIKSADDETDPFDGIDAPEAQLRLHKLRTEQSLAEYQATLAGLKQDLQQKQAEQAAVHQRIEQLNGTIPLISERADALKGLLGTKMIARVDWLEIEEERVEQVKEREVQRQTSASLKAGIASVRERIKVMQAQFTSDRLTELSEVETRIEALTQEHIKAEKKVTLQRLIAPVSGRVHQLAIHTVGGVVTPAQELMRIVPGEEAIEIEAWLQNRDIGFVEEGQAAEIKVETFPFTKYGTITGMVKTLSNDAVADEQRGLVYATRVAMNATTMLVNGKTINLSPGMAVTVEMNLGKRRLIEYLLSPLLRYKDESVRER